MPAREHECAYLWERTSGPFCPDIVLVLSVQHIALPIKQMPHNLLPQYRHLPTIRSCGWLQCSSACNWPTHSSTDHGQFLMARSYSDSSVSDDFSVVSYHPQTFQQEIKTRILTPTFQLIYAVGDNMPDCDAWDLSSNPTVGSSCVCHRNQCNIQPYRQHTLPAVPRTT